MWDVSVTMGKVTAVKSSVASGHFGDGLKLSRLQITPCLLLSVICYRSSWITEQSEYQNHSSLLHPSPSHWRQILLCHLRLSNSPIVIWFGWSKVTVIASYINDMIWIIIWLQSTIQRISSPSHQLISSPWCPGLIRKFCNSDNIL